MPEHQPRPPNVNDPDGRQRHWNAAFVWNGVQL